MSIKETKTEGRQVKFRLPEQELTGKQRDKDCEEIRTKKKPHTQQTAYLPPQAFQSIQTTAVGRGGHV